MEKISIPYHDKVFDFIYYSTTINRENIFFVATMDKEAIAMLKANHFFLKMDLLEGNYLFNAIEKTKEEVDFKEHVSETIMAATFSYIPMPANN